MANNRPHLLVVDGSNLLFQMFYGMPARIIGKAGKPIHGTLGFVGALLKMLRFLRPTHVVVLFDGEHHNERKDMDESYKANRPDFSKMPEEETPFSQLPDIYAALDFLKIKHAETTVCETDDIVAAYAFTYGKEIKITLSSFDSDFFQLIDENVSVLRYRGENSVLCDKTYLMEKYGVTPAQYADFKALVGDSADNVPGIKGIGPKTAAKLLKDFGSAQLLLEQAERIERLALRNAVKDGKERILLNLRLIRLCGCDKIPFSIDELSFVDGGERTGEVLTAIGVR